jgi:predicted small metal-binding protein
MFAGKALRCDCGYEVRALDEDAFVEGIRRHAREAHGIDLSVELALELARNAPLAPNERAGLEHDGVAQDRWRPSHAANSTTISRRLAGAPDTKGATQ